MEARIIDALSRPKHFFNLLESKNSPQPELPQSFENFKTAVINDQVIGLVGFEQYGNYGMLLSLSVSRSLSSHEITDELLYGIEHKAASQGIETLYLITENAAAYFHKKGYYKIQLTAVPNEVLRSSKVKNHHASYSVVMMKSL